MSGFHAVLLATDDADLDLEDDVGRLARREELLGDLEVLIERHGRAVPHVALEDRQPAGLDALCARRDERAHEGVELVLGAVVGVQRNGDAVLLGDDVSELGQRHGAGHHVFDPQARAELGTAGGKLNDSVGSGIGEALDGGVDRIR